jgi:adenylate cyclase class 2
MQKEIECRFLDIDKSNLVSKLKSLGALDLGEKLLDETIVYDQDLKWLEERRFVRVRKNGDKIVATYKEHREHKIGGAFELEFEISDYDKAVSLFEKIGLRAYRRQQKTRWSFILEGVNIDIDTWPTVPSYVEIEGIDEEKIKEISEKLGLDWGKVNVHDALWVLENVYKLKVSKFRSFTFDKIE